MWLSYPIMSALMGMLVAQFVKIPIHFLTSRELKWGLFFSTGGMPSSHSATVVSLTTAIGLTSGVFSNEFAICVVLSSIVMHDAIGVRRQAGFHAEVLNQLMVDFNSVIESLKDPNLKKPELQRKLKVLLGHKPLEVFFGIITGIVVALSIYHFYH